jgi:hypothetical protein
MNINTEIIETMEQIRDLVDWFVLHHTLLARYLSVKSSIPVLLTLRLS